MGIYMIFGFTIPVVLGIVLAKNFREWCYFIMFLAIPLVSVPFTLNYSNIPVDSYPYQASVTLTNEKNQTTIYFSQFQQDGSKVTINQYCENGIHWTDFTPYDVCSTPLTIFLTDNDDNFIYEDRLKSNNFATQP